MDIIRMYILLNTDVKMSPGKAAAQAAHAAVNASLYSLADEFYRKKFEIWMAMGSTKIVLGARETQLLELVRKMNLLGTPHALIKDAGQTEVAPGSITALGIAPRESRYLYKELGLGGYGLYKGDKV